MTKGRPRRPMPDYTLEYKCIVRHKGVVVSEYNFRLPNVEVVSYFPSGLIQSHGRYSIDEFIEIIKRIQSEQESPYKEHV